MSKTLICASLLLGLLVVACNEEETGPTTLIIETDLTINGAPIDTGSIYPLGENEIKIAAANAYLGGFTVNAGDSSISVSDYVLLNDSDQRVSIPGELDPTAGISTVQFFVGVEPAINNQSEAEFLARAVEDPLSIKDPAMHWNWNSGYRFVRVDAEAYIPIKEIRLVDSLPILDTMEVGAELIFDTIGYVDVLDTVTIATDTALIEYHIGTDSLLAPIVIDSGISNLQPGENTMLVRFDVAGLFRDIDLGDSTNRVTHTFDNLPLALRVRDNIQQHVIGYRLN